MNLYKTDTEDSEKVTVIIPVCNREDWIGDSISSVLNQTRPPEEVIIVDDGSTDNSAGVIKSFGDRVTYIYQNNQGVSAARNTGIKSANFPWLAFLDSDDQWHPEKLASQLQFLSENPSCRVIHTDEIWIRHGRRVNPRKVHQKHGGMIYDKCLPRCVISPSSVMIHHTIFEDYGLFDETLPACEDYDMWLRICRSEPVGYVDQPLITKFGGHQDQLSRSVEALDRFRVRILLDQLENYPLNQTQICQLLNVMIKKADILASGSRKRENFAAMRWYRGVKDRAASLQKWFCVPGCNSV